jgi:glyoxylase-like metal-dependent hydrolase (beta-lactamase superfamily II)
VTETRDLYFRQVAVGDMANFAYLIGSLSSREALIVDPAWDVDGLLDAAESDGMQVVGGQIFGHDIEGVARLLERQPVPIHVHAHEAEGMRKITGASENDLRRHESGDVVLLGQIRVRLLHTPGHTPGSQCFLVEEEGRPASLVSGDTLFLGSCGRVDLPGSDPEAMYRSLNHTLRELPDDTLLYPGHLYSVDPVSTMGEQKRSNPFLRVTSLEQFLTFMGA